MTSPFPSLEPRVLWNHFDQLRQTPRPSRHEDKVIAYVVGWAKSKGYAVEQDAVKNLVIRVPATPGHETAPTVIVQGHLDMVAEKDKATEFDFMKDAIPVKLEGDWLIAEHTTLGADNGIGVAAGLAAAEDPTVVHGPLELLFTVDEETALTGATSLDGRLLKGRILLNLDSEEDGTLFVGCAGGTTTTMHAGLKRAAAPAGGMTLKIEVGGLKGGHSGLAIHENRGNSLKVLARVLLRMITHHGAVHIDSLEGGNKHNAIPREASAVVVVPGASIEKAQNLVKEVAHDFLSEIGGGDPGLTIKVEAAAPAARPGDADSSRRLVQLLTATPNGLVTMSRDLPGLVETSTNLAVATTEGDKVTVLQSSRSSVAAALRGVLDQVATVARMAGAEVEESGGYPGWQPNMASRLLAICREVHGDLRGGQPKVTAIHAGLECGLIGEKLGGNVDMISFGPQLDGVHAPGEKVEVKSVGRFWEFLKAVLRHLAH